MKCNECSNANICLDHIEILGLGGCTSGIPDCKVITNADRIRNMSDEELLDFICSIETYDEGSVKTIENGVSMHTVTEVRAWLQSEAE